MNQTIIRRELRKKDVLFDDQLLKTVLENMTEIKCVKGPRNSNVYYLNG